MAWSLGLQSLWPAGAEKAFCLEIQRRRIRRSWRRASGFWADFVIIWILMELWATSVFLLETFQGLFTTSRKIYCSLFLDASLHGSSKFEPYDSFNPPPKKLASLRIILAPKRLIGGGMGIQACELGGLGLPDTSRTRGRQLNVATSSCSRETCRTNRKDIRIANPPSK